MDKCSRCRGQLYFHGISTKPIWLKWMECSNCGLFSSCNEFGTLQTISKQVPPEAVFIRFTGKDDR